MHLASLATVGTSLTGCTLTVAMGAGESSQTPCPRPMLGAARLGLEQAALQGDAKALPPLGPCPMGATATSCMANPVGTPQMTADAPTSLIGGHGPTIGKGKCEVAPQDFGALPMCPTNLVGGLGNGQTTMADADIVACGIMEVEELSKHDGVQRVVVGTAPRAQVERMVRTMGAARTVGACALVEPAGHPIPPLGNMVVVGPSTTPPCGPMAFAGHMGGSRYFGGA